MASIINSDDGVISGTAGLKSTGANDGALNIQTNGTNAITVSSAQTVAINGNNISADNSLGFRNRIINGDMGIAQRTSSSTANVISNSTLRYDTVDRWGYWAEAASKFTVSQSSTAPTGFSTSALITSSTALSVGAGTFYSFAQRIEGFNFSDFGFGTANAKSFTVSFWVRSSITGTFPFYCFNSGYSRTYVSTFTINAANTWEQKTITVAGDTSGTWVGATNGYGIEVGFTLAAGSNYFQPSANTWSSTNFGLGLSGATNFLSTNGATLNITGFQLEVGSVATPFERRDYGRELIMCQRYYYRTTPTSVGRIAMAASAVTNSTGRAVIPFPVTMRAAPSALEQSGTAGDYSIFFLTTATACTSVPTFSTGTIQASEIVWTATAGHTAGNAGTFYSTGTAGYLAWSAEL